MEAMRSWMSSLGWSVVDMVERVVVVCDEVNKAQWAETPCDVRLIS